ncbi:hypothetical protein TIFTF001_003834 [Ficus carica]|uniref:Uncharacterized protein n=1 Tax=Ficus carica TaxID=3494 RepID=A0AA87ZGK9_FICCA|nr:hypothetical protein TIFTF001_003834 [Ficus carica]
MPFPQPLSPPTTNDHSSSSPSSLQPDFTLSPLPSFSLTLPNSPPNPTNRGSPISLPEATPCFSNSGTAIW